MLSSVVEEKRLVSKVTGEWLELVIIPDFITKALEAHKWPKERALDIMSLARILSLEDVCFYIAINMYLFEQLPKAFQETFSSFNFNNDKYVMNDSGGYKPSKVDIDNYRKRVDNNVWSTITANQWEGKNKLTFLSALPHEISNELSSKENDNEFLFDVSLIGDGLYGVCVKPADTHKSFAVQVLDCYEQTLSVLMMDNKFEEVVLTPLFAQYTKLARIQ